MLLLEAPYPTPTVSLTLPSAQLDNSIARDDTLKIQQSMSGVFYSYKRTNEYHILGVNIVNIRQTELDTLKTYYKTYTRLRLTDHLNRQWDVKFNMSPLNITIDSRVDACDEEGGTVSLQFIGLYLGVLGSP